MILAQGKQRRLRLGRRRLGAAQRHQIAPQIAAAVDPDVAGQGHDGNPSRLCGGPLLLGPLRLQAVQIIRGALRMGGGAEDRPPVVLQHGYPRGDIGGVILADFRRDIEIGA
jgi:hypothetical protein